VLREVEPDLTAATRIVRVSDWHAFPPIACQAGADNSQNTVKLRDALLHMHEHAKGREALAALRLDRFEDEPVSLFNSIAANMSLVRGVV